jgi:hypothetical protein
MFDRLIELASTEAPPATAGALQLVGDPFLFKDAVQSVGYLGAGFKAEEVPVVVHLTRCSMIEFSKYEFPAIPEGVRHRVEVWDDAVPAEPL